MVNPADHRDVVGEVIEPTEDMIGAMVTQALKAAPAWAGVSPAERAAMLHRAAGAMEARMELFMPQVGSADWT